MGNGMACLPGMRAVEASMPGKSKLTADAAEQAVLRALSKSEQRGEAERARAILLTLEGRKAEEIAAVLGVHPWTPPERKAKIRHFQQITVVCSHPFGLASRHIWPPALMIIRRSVPYHIPATSGFGASCTFPS